MIVDRGPLQGDGRLGPADLTQRDRRGDADVLEVIVLQDVDQRRYGARVAQPAEGIGGLLAAARVEALEPLAHQGHLVRRRRGRRTGPRAAQPAAAAAAHAAAAPAPAAAESHAAATAAAEREVHERRGRPARIRRPAPAARWPADAGRARADAATGRASDAAHHRRSLDLVCRSNVPPGRLI